MKDIFPSQTPNSLNQLAGFRFILVKMRFPNENAKTSLVLGSKFLLTLYYHSNKRRFALFQSLANENENYFNIILFL